MSTAVVGVAACSGGALRWWQTDGKLVPLRYSIRLRRAAALIAERESYLATRPYRGRGGSPALPARLARIPAISIGSLDRDGLVPRSHQKDDHAEAVDEAVMEDAVQFGLMLIDAIDASVARSDTRTARA